MRVISGNFRGLKLESISENEIRPTTDRVKESVFNILQFEIAEKSFLDLFGGSGQMGIEAASRGAKEVIIVEKNKKSLKVIRSNIKKIREKSNIKVVDSDSIEFLKNCKSRVDIVFVDPPYFSDLLDESFKFLEFIVSFNGIIVVEASPEKEVASSIGDFKKVGSYKYGNTVIYIYR